MTGVKSRYSGEKWSFNSEIKSNTYGILDINNRPGKMEDSDWGVYPTSSTSTLDIYSESDCSIDSFIASAGFDYCFRPFYYYYYYFKIGTILEYQYLDYIVYDLEQDNYYYDIHYSVNGKVATYNVQYWLPCIFFSPILKYQWLSIEMSVQLSPFVMAFDTDDHILRKKISEGTSTGFSYKFGLNARADIKDYFFMKFGVSYLYLETEGTQHQEFYETTAEADKSDWSIIDNKLVSEQTVLSFSIGKIF